MTAVVDRPVHVTDSGDEAIDLDFPNGDDLALSRGSDFYGPGRVAHRPGTGHPGPGAGVVRHRVGPAAAGFWERPEFPVELAKEDGRLGAWQAASIVGDGCPGLTFLAEGVIAAELARGDGSIATLNAVHSGLAMTTIALLGSPSNEPTTCPGWRPARSWARSR